MSTTPTTVQSTYLIENNTKGRVVSQLHQTLPVFFFSSSLPFCFFLVSIVFDLNIHTLADMHTEKKKRRTNLPPFYSENVKVGEKKKGKACCRVPESRVPHSCLSHLIILLFFFCCCCCFWFVVFQTHKNGNDAINTKVQIKERKKKKKKENTN